MAAFCCACLHLMDEAEANPTSRGQTCLKPYTFRSLHTIAPTLVRLPGYPAFLAFCFAAFGQQNYQAVLYLQVILDLATCLLIAGFVYKVCGRRAAMAALWLAALCPFTANYVAMPLTELQANRPPARAVPSRDCKNKGHASRRRFRDWGLFQ